MATSQTRRAGIYVRISQDATGKKAGVTRQLKDCRALAKRLRWTVVDTYDDNDVSAFNGEVRKDFERLLADIKAGGIDAVVCWHPDRLYRRVKDLQRLVEITDAGVHIASVNGGDLDLSNSTGRMLARIIGSVAEQESEHKGERRVAANAQRAANGEWRADGPRVFGYTQRGERLEPEASAVTKAAEDVLNGVSLRSIAMDWNARGLLTTRGKRWSALTLRRMLMRPHYAALRVYQGSVVGPGNWDKLFDEETHRGLVQLLSDPARRPNSAFVRKYLGSGVYVCGRCGGKLYAAHPHGPDKLLYICRTTHLGRAGAPIDAMVEAVVLGVLAETDIATRLTRRPGIDTVTLRVKRQTLVARRDELATLFAEGVLDGPGVKRESEKLAASIAAIDAQLTEAARRSTAATLLVDGPGALRRHWDAASPDIRGKVVDELMTVTVMPVTQRGHRGFDPSLIRIEPKVGT
jgi:DNA invertase Pin-like site-specific DNA recombinase